MGCAHAGITTGGSAIVQRNLVTSNNVGILMGGSNVTIRNNTIAYNDIGIWGPSGQSTVIYNNVENSTSYNFYLYGFTGVYNATYNWWGTTDIQTINQSIYDFKNDFNIGNLTFVPFLTNANPEAPLNIPPTTPTPSPTPTITATPDQTTNPTLIPTASTTTAPSQQPTQTIWLYATVAALAGTVVTLLIIIAVIIRKIPRTA